MLQQSPAKYTPLDDISDTLATERPRLVRLCQRLTGDAAAAEDLTQETLLTAWRLRERVSAPEGLSAWLAAIARNHWRRWARAQSGDRSRIISLNTDDSDPLVEQRTASLVADDADPADAIERDEVAELARRALALAPEASRDLLVAVYLAEAPRGDVAQVRAVSDSALRVRLLRARRALREAIGVDGELRARLEDLGLTLPASDGWQESRIWCPFCGANYLRYRVDRDTGEYAFHCAGPCAGRAVAGAAKGFDLVREVSSPKSLLARHCLMLDSAYRSALQDNWALCDCGERVTFAYTAPNGMALGSPISHGIEGFCPRCGQVDSASAWHLALDTIEAQRFWRRYPRMRALPMREAEQNGRAVIVTGFEAVGTSARLEMVSDARDYTVLRSEVNHTS